MKQGKSIVELATELQRRAEQSQDYIADTREMELTPEGQLNIGDTVHTDVNPLAHGQIAERTGIPKRYYDTMRAEQPELLARNVNTWFAEKPAQRMVRTLDGNARAFLSDRYRRVDNHQIAEAALPALLESSSGFDITSSDVTDTRLYIQARLPRVEGEVRKGDPVQAGLIITNSEVGLGAIDIRPMIYRLVCTNGMVSGTTVKEGRMRKTHLGGQVLADDNIQYRAETHQAMDRALMEQIRDAIRQLSDPAQFQRLMDQMRTAAEGDAVTNPIKAVEALGKAYALPKLEQDSILESLIRDQDYTRWGVLNAVTRQANDAASYDRAVELEALGGQVLNMPRNAWETIAAAA